MKSKRLLAVLMIAALTLLGAAPSAALAADWKDDKALVLSHVTEDYPDWQVSFTEQYGSGRWKGELAMHVGAGLYRVEDDALVQKTLHVLVNSLRAGDEG